ncbi:PREDICTED: uncharacterized protein LOC108748806 [Trachymyrmex septentrionalis]|uniref:uncharacterized protein LOC108748806 n=1 Tax=Trachymyrmex septentrionalis TaxID=34720 RepID=UPI00084EF337|nr:PREDICTED: uncharacterized protein LOC108748806 [Trachymyrmex septentrionalis]
MSNVEDVGPRSSSNSGSSDGGRNGSGGRRSRGTGTISIYTRILLVRICVIYVQRVYRVFLESVATAFREIDSRNTLYTCICECMDICEDVLVDMGVPGGRRCPAQPRGSARALAAFFFFFAVRRRHRIAAKVPRGAVVRKMDISCLDKEVCPLFAENYLFGKSRGHQTLETLQQLIAGLTSILELSSSLSYSRKY